MFCANCGTKIDDGIYKCGKCGWESPIKPATPAAPAVPARPAAAPAAPAAPVRPAAAPAAPAAPARPAAAPAAPAAPARPAAAPAAPAAPARPAAAPAAPAASAQKPITHITPQVNTGNAANSPAPNVVVQNVAPAAKPKKKKTGLIIAIVLIAVLFFGGLAVGAGFLIYYNSDSYKVNEAVECIEIDCPNLAYDYIEYVYTNEAMASKDFLNVEFAKEDFINAVSTNGRDLSKSNEKFFAFIEEMESFKDSIYFYYLPDELVSRYEAYKAAVTFTDKFVYMDSDASGFYDVFYDVQYVMLNEIDRNNSSEYGSDYTMRDFQQRIKVTNDALDILDGYNFSSITLDSATISSCSAIWYTDKSAISLSTSANSIIDTLVEACRSEAQISQELVNENLEKFGYDEPLYREYTEYNFSQDVGMYLEPIADESDIDDNASKLAGILREEILYALLTGSTPTSTY